MIRFLDQEIRGRGRGAISAVERAVGKGEGWWQGRVRAGDITVDQLLGILDHLGLAPSAFVRRALADSRTLELDRPLGPVPEIVAKAWRRIQDPVDVDGVGATYLETLDRHRYRRPGEVIKMAHWAIDHVEPGLLPRLLGITGSAWRMQMELDNAAHAIHAGLELAHQRSDTATVGDLLQRLSYVLTDQGEQERALGLAERAAAIHLRNRDRAAFGRALVDQGIWLLYLDRPRESIAVLEHALGELAEGPSRSRMAALHCLGLAHQRSGNLGAALEHAIAAPRAVARIGRWDEAKLLWLRGRIYHDLERFDQAVECFEEVVMILRQIHLGEAVLATCELLRAQLSLGEAEKAFQVAMSMVALVEPLRTNKVLSSAIRELVGAGRAGMTLALVKQIEARIEDERRRRDVWRSLGVESEDDPMPSHEARSPAPSSKGPLPEGTPTRRDLDSLLPR
ncbi:MAG: tetratricopeptide repeat protein [Acidobacteriota bacterium]